MKKLTQLLASSISLLLVACATPNLAQPMAVKKSPKVLEQERRLRESEEARQDQEDRSRILSKKNQMRSPAIAARVHPQNKKIIITGTNQVTAKNDRELYGELAGAYERNNEIAFFSRFQAFQEKYPSSPLADEAFYLAGLMSLSNKNYGPALRYMNVVLKKYPTSNKASGALFAKGVILKRMNLTDESRVAFQKVRKAYPGSPESLRAEAELKLLNK